VEGVAEPPEHRKAVDEMFERHLKILFVFTFGRQREMKFFHNNVYLLVLFCLVGCAVTVPSSVETFAPSSLLEPPKDPILRIDTGSHSETIFQVSVDAVGRTFLTCSEDKTARLYDVKTGTLLRVFRPPIGAGFEGQLYACALSPDGTLAAVGGHTGIEWDKNFLWGDWVPKVSIYIFEVSTGALVRRISDWTNIITDLDFSGDGSLLAVGHAGKSGVCLFHTSDGEEVGQDSDYGDDSHCVHFSADGRLVSTSYDGFLRLYDQSLNLLKKVQAPGGHWPSSARFSPDGTRIAVGYVDSSQVDIFSGSSLQHLSTADTKGVMKPLSNVAWSVDGRTLYAGGWYYKKIHGQWQTVVLSWSDAGYGTCREYGSGFIHQLMDLTPLPAGYLLFAGSGPILGVLDSDGSSRLLTVPPTADFRALGNNFKLSTEGMSVRFGYLYGGELPICFDIEQQKLLPDMATTAPLYAPRISADGFTVTDWKNTETPKLNGAPLKLTPHEMSRSLAITPDEQHFVLGTNWTLRYFDTTGEQLWEKTVPGAWAVNIPPNGQVVAAAYGDGTIRWHRLSDGEELLAFFPHADQKRWVMWTPTGYYDASIGGEDLIGWHVNNGKDNAADFFPASRFRDNRYRPDIVAKVLMTFDEAKAIIAANIENKKRPAADLSQLLPPVVSITSHQNGSRVSREQVNLQVEVRSPSGIRVTGLKVLVDGRPVSSADGFAITATQTRVIRTLDVTIPPRDCELSVIAETADSASVPAIVKLTWVGIQPKQDEFIAKPKLYVLAIGVSQYQSQNLTLYFAAKDALDFAAVMNKQKGGLYRDVVIKVLTDGKATKDNILDGLDWLERETTSRDVAMLFMAGHGVNDRNGTYYYLPHNTDLDSLKRTGVPFHDIKNTLAALAGKTLLFVDTCYSGNVMGGRRAVPADINGLVNELTSAENGVVVFASSTGKQYSIEDSKWNNGAFTKALVEGLLGAADYSGTGKISINMLDLYLSERVKELTQGKQTPTTTKPRTIPDFPVAVCNF